LGALTEGFLWIEQPKTSDLYEIRSLVKEHYAQHGLDLIVIDYLQMMEVGVGAQRKRYDNNRQQEVSTISRTVKMLTRELEVPIIGICQLNRNAEGREDHRPRLSDLKESGALEQDADTVLLLYRDDYYNKDSPTPNICDVEVAKNRSGRTGVIETVFLRDMLLFENKADLPVGDGFAPPSDARVPD
jgi:replicative DNA helicase